MSWRDFFYFSKGERSALIILLCLITIAVILLIISNKQNAAIKNDTAATPNAVQVDTAVTDKAMNKKDYTHTKSNYQQKYKESNTQYADNKKGNSESVVERADRIITASRNTSRPSYPRSEKFEEATVVELNVADTTILKKVPGIGSSYANRILKFRDLLGGFYSVNQLAEVYGMDEERFNTLKSWFTVDTSLIKKLNVNELTADELRKHPYIDYRQAKAITQLRKQKGKLTGWENLQLLDEFTDIDKIRTLPYLAF